MTVVNEIKFLDSYAMLEPYLWQESGAFFIDAKIPKEYWEDLDPDHDPGFLQEQADEWAVKTLCSHFGLNEKEFYKSTCPYEENLCLCLIPLTLVPDYVIDGDYWYNFNTKEWVSH